MTVFHISICHNVLLYDILRGWRYNRLLSLMDCLHIRSVSVWTGLWWRWSSGHVFCFLVSMLSIWPSYGHLSTHILTNLCPPSFREGWLYVSYRYVSSYGTFSPVHSFYVNIVRIDSRARYCLSLSPLSSGSYVSWRFYQPIELGYCP